MNLWHDIAPGSEAPQQVNVILEISKGSKVKYEIDKETGLLKLDRILFSSVHYPAAYGFIPQTYCDDKDPLDALVLCSEGLQPLTLVETRVIGAMKMIDKGEMDDKIIAVAAEDVHFKHLTNLEQLPQHQLDEIKQFFIDYKTLEKKKVEVTGFVGKEEAEALVTQSIELYKTTFPKA